MARVRWTGDGDREVMVTVETEGGTTVEQVDAPRMAWVEVPQHVAQALNKQGGWELESVKKAQKTRAKKDGD